MTTHPTDAEIDLLGRAFLGNCGPQACGFTAPQTESQPVPVPRWDEMIRQQIDLPPLPIPDLRDVGTTPQDIQEFLQGYATEYAKVALAVAAKRGSQPEARHIGGTARAIPVYTAPQPAPAAQAADSVLEDAAQVEIDLFNDLNRIYGNTLTAYAKEMCRLGYRKTNAGIDAVKQWANQPKDTK